MTARRLVPAIAAALLGLTPRVLQACAVCFDARDQNRVAFLATTVFMSLLPLGMIGALGLWLRRRARALSRDGGAEGTLPPAS